MSREQPSASSIRERRWIVLASDGRHFSFCHRTNLSSDDLDEAGVRLRSLSLGGWLAVMEGDYYTPSSNVQLLMVRPLADTTVEWVDAVSAFDAYRGSTLAGS